MSEITIYHPSKYLGGTEILFSRVIELLISRGFKNINVVDFNDGVLSSKLRNNDVIYHDVMNFDKAALFENSRLIASARNISRILYECKEYDISNLKPMFWLLHPSELYSGYCIGSSALKRIGYRYLKLFINILPAFNVYKNIIRSLDVNENLWIMDGACLSESEWALDYSFRNDIILPLITNLEQSLLPYRKDSAKNFAILSRLDDFKVYGIMKIIDDIILYNSINDIDNIAVSIIGDGPARSMLEGKYKGKLNIIFRGYVNNNDLTDLFKTENFSILFAMGTSILEGCSRGVPTVLLPSTDRPIINRDNIYRYLHLNKGIDLGEYINTPFESSGYMNFNEMMNYFEKNKNKLAEYSGSFFEEHYGKAVTQDKLLSVIMGGKVLSVNNIKVSKLFSVYTRCLSNKRLRSGV
ncbi:hypothetical protein [Enterobacter hormaechei]|uniref:hypothetical protein n=2 Tax=Enterobacter TaxID=547 RepID=UPI0039C08FCE